MTDFISDKELSPSKSMQPLVSITKHKFGVMSNGQNVDKYVLRNRRRMVVEIINYGGIITSWTAPDKNDKYENIVLGYDNLTQYLKEHPYFGALIGRYANRIAKGQFVLDGQTYELETNAGPNHLHGGVKGFDKVVWSAIPSSTNSSASLQLTHISKDGENGYPGNLTTIITYTLRNDNSLEVAYEATTDKKTIINLTQHSYFNLSGDFSTTILDHQLSIDADHFLPVNDFLIPTGELRLVEGTPFDFKKPKAIGRDIEQIDDQLLKGKGYDHCWILNNDGILKKVATAYHPTSGRQLEIFSSEPGVQFYSGNSIDGTLPKPTGGNYGRHSGFCLETQHFPNSPNQASFPSTVLMPQKKYTSKTVFKFTNEKL